jgi:hypothetical protein
MDGIIVLQGFAPPSFLGKSIQNKIYLHKRQWELPGLNSLDPDLILSNGTRTNFYW